MGVGGVRSWDRTLACPHSSGASMVARENGVLTVTVRFRRGPLSTEKLTYSVGYRDRNVTVVLQSGA